MPWLSIQSENLAMWRDSMWSWKSSMVSHSSYRNHTMLEVFICAHSQPRAAPHTAGETACGGTAVGACGPDQVDPVLDWLWACGCATCRGPHTHLDRAARLWAQGCAAWQLA